MKAFPKIFALGTRHVYNIFDGVVEITEKIDGSQSGFGKVNGELHMRSKGKMLVLDAPDKMFAPGVEYIKSIEDRLPNNFWFWAEYLRSPKHNVLKYDRIPKNHFALFGCMNLTVDRVLGYYHIASWADELGVDVVPLIFQGEADDMGRVALEYLRHCLDRDSFLGGTKIEGVVIKNYHDHEVAGVIHPIQAAKFVSEKFKEQIGQKVRQGKAVLPDFFESFRTEARWQKAIQHLRDDGLLSNEPKDIGPLIKEIQRDLVEECQETIMHYLYNHFIQQILRKVIAGFPEYYKEYLVKEAYDENTTSN